MKLLFNLFNRLFFVIFAMGLLFAEAFANDAFRVIAKNGLVCDAKKTKCMAKGGVSFIGKGIKASSEQFVIYFDEKEKLLKRIEGSGSVRITVEGQLDAKSEKFIFRPRNNSVELLDKVNLLFKNSPSSEELMADALLLEFFKDDYNIDARNVIIKGKKDNNYSYIVKSYKMTYHNKESKASLSSLSKGGEKASLDNRVRGVYLFKHK